MREGAYLQRNWEVQLSYEICLTGHLEGTDGKVPTCSNIARFSCLANEKPQIKPHSIKYTRSDRVVFHWNGAVGGGIHVFPIS